MTPSSTLESSKNLTPAKRLLSLYKRKALRERVWLRTLSREERGIIDLCIRCDVKLSSMTLVRVLVKIVGKISFLLKSSFMEGVEALGRPLAEGLSRVAYSWGNEGALGWADDPAYVRCVGLGLLGFRVPFG